MHYLSEMCIR